MVQSIRRMSNLPAMDSASIPPRRGHLYDSDQGLFRNHPRTDLSQARLLPDTAVRRTLPDTTSRSQTTTTTAADALPSAASTSADATVNHQNHAHNHSPNQTHHNHIRHQNCPQHQHLHPVSEASHIACTSTAPPTARVPTAPPAPAPVCPSAARPTPSVHSQDSNLSAESDTVFTPPASQSEMPSTSTNGHNSSQESQLLRLSHAAAAQDKLAEDGAAVPSRKRRADGVVKEDTSPVRMHHSRNISTASIASTAASSVGDWSSDLKTRLSYAMLKVNHGWQSHSIDEVESMASQAASPTSSHSTLQGRKELSTSPRANIARYQPASAPTTASSGPSPATYESFWKEGQISNQTSVSPPTSAQHAPTLAPPAPIQPSRPAGSHNPRRNSNPRYTPTLLSHSHSVSPHTPGQQPAGVTSNQRSGRTSLIDPILFSPHQNVREQDAIETLMFMSSPGNSANMKHNYAQPVASSLSGRRTLPDSQPRKILPSQRPVQPKRVGFEKSPGSMTAMSDMDVDMDSPQSRGPMRRRMHCSASFLAGSILRPQLSLPAALGSTSKPRTRLADADIERMIDQAAQAGNSSDDDDDEILIPGRNRPEGSVGI